MVAPLNQALATKENIQETSSYTYVDVNLGGNGMRPSNKIVRENTAKMPEDVRAKQTSTYNQRLIKIPV